MMKHLLHLMMLWYMVSLLDAPISAKEVASTDRPNILFILVDDLGWKDLKCYGHPWHDSENIDRLAADGMRFTQAYAPAPICSASRASILTGKTPARIGLEFVVKDQKADRQNIIPRQLLEAPKYKNELDLHETTIADSLGDLGYETAYFGKWHLNPHEGKYLGWSPSHGPKQNGFTTAIEDFGSHPYSGNKLEVFKENGKYHQDGLTQKAIAFLKRDHESPFFLMVSHFYVHTPIKSPYEWLLEKYESKIPTKAKNRRNRIEYAAFVETLDHHVGELLEALQDAGLEENTVVIFLSDNGSHPQYTSNKPLRGSKWNLYEGGIRVPLIVRWPGKETAGSVCSAPVVGYDLFPTLKEISGTLKDVPPLDLDGKSFLPLLENPDQDWVRSLYWHFPYYHPEGALFGKAQKEIGVDDFAISQTRPHSAIRRGDYKLIYFDEKQRSEVYDLSKDPSEQNNLSEQLTDLDASLRNELGTYLERVKARSAQATKHN